MIQVFCCDLIFQPVKNKGKDQISYQSLTLYSFCIIPHHFVFTCIPLQSLQKVENLTHSYFIHHPNHLLASGFYLKRFSQHFLP